MWRFFHRLQSFAHAMHFHPPLANGTKHLLDVWRREGVIIHQRERQGLEGFLHIHLPISFNDDWRICRTVGKSEGLKKKFQKSWSIDTIYHWNLTLNFGKQKHLWCRLASQSQLEDPCSHPWVSRTPSHWCFRPLLRLLASVSSSMDSLGSSSTIPQKQIHAPSILFPFFMWKIVSRPPMQHIAIIICISPKHLQRSRESVSFHQFWFLPNRLSRAFHTCLAWGSCPVGKQLDC